MEKEKERDNTTGKNFQLITRADTTGQLIDHHRTAKEK